MALNPVDPSASRYLDTRYPLSIIIPSQLRKSSRHSEDKKWHRINIAAKIYDLDAHLPKRYPQGPLSIEWGWLDVNIEPDLPTKINPESFSPQYAKISASGCYDEIPYSSEEGVKQISQKLLVFENDRWVEKLINARLETIVNIHIDDDSDGCDDNQTCHSENQRIFPQLPEGVIPKDMSAYIEARYTVSNPENPPEVRAAKTKVNELICETLKSITWVQGLGTPPQWDLIIWPDQLPLVKISTSAEK